MATYGGAIVLTPGDGKAVSWPGTQMMFKVKGGETPVGATPSWRA